VRRGAAAIAIAVLIACPASAQTTANDASCDISVTPAATLLLPYFEVETAVREAYALAAPKKLSRLLVSAAE